MGLAAGVVILARGLNVSSESCLYFIVNLLATKRAPGLPLWVSQLSVGIARIRRVTLSWIYAYNQMPFLCNGVIILFEK